MKNLRIIYILAKASFKQSTDGFFSFITALMTPLAYSAVFIAQTYLYYQINPTPFEGISIAKFYVCLFVNQLVIFLLFEKNVKALTNDIITSKIDLVLIRPFNLFIYKYFRTIRFPQLVMPILFIIGLTISIIWDQTPEIVVVKLIIFIFLSAIITNNILAALYGLGTFTRESNPIVRLKESIIDLTQLKPPEIFPVTLRGVLIFVIPFIVTFGFMFDIVRYRDSLGFWLIIGLWVIISALLNYFVWKKVLANYESAG
jgi:ABC-type uncharacterized transport system permease subunit